MLAQDSSDIGSIFFVSLVLIVLVIGGFFAVVVLRKKLKDSESPDDSGEGGFSLSSLRELHRDGKFSTEEFERTKHLIVEAAKASAAKAAAERAAAQKPVHRPLR